jgi:hypothetical protein
MLPKRWSGQRAGALFATQHATWAADAARNGRVWPGSAQPRSVGLVDDVEGRRGMVRQRVVIVGAGFAGVHAARGLRKVDVDVVIVNPTDHFLYLPLLPEVTAGILDPRRVSVGLSIVCPSARLRLGTVDDVDLSERKVSLVDPEGNRRHVEYDRLLITAGSVNKLLPVPGVAEHAHGYRSIAEALYLRDHLVRQIELADAADTQAERDARCTFVVVGAGYTGTEVAAQGQLLTRALARRFPRLRDQTIRWLLLDKARRVLPNWPGGCRRRRIAHCPAAASRSVPARRWTRPRPTASACRTGSSCRPARSSGASGCGRTRSSSSSACRPSAGGSPSTSTSPCPTTRTCSRAATSPLSRI